MPMEERQKKMIVGGIVSILVMVSIIFVFMFLAGAGPFSKYVEPNDFWEKVGEIVKEEKIYNEQWYVKSERKQDTDMWSVQLFGSKNKVPAKMGNAISTLIEGKKFVWSKMTKAQVEECSAKFKVSEIYVKKEGTRGVVSFINHLTMWEAPVPNKVDSKDFWKTVAEIRKNEKSYNHWYTKRTRIEDGAEGAFEVEFIGSREKKKSKRTKIEKTIREGKMFVWSIMKPAVYGLNRPYGLTTETIVNQDEADKKGETFIDYLTKVGKRKGSRGRPLRPLVRE